MAVLRDIEKSLGDDFKKTLQEAWDNMDKARHDLQVIFDNKKYLDNSK